MEVNEKFYFELLENGVSEEIALCLSRQKAVKATAKKKKKIAAFYAGKEQEMYEVITTLHCSTCGHSKELKRLEKKDRPEKIVELTTCGYCADYLLSEFSHEELVTISILQNHHEDSIHKLLLGSKLKLATRKSALDWLMVKYPRTDNRPDDYVEKEEKPKEEVIEINREEVLQQLIESGIPKELAEVMLMKTKKKKKSKKTVTKREIIVTKTCDTCGTAAGFKHELATNSPINLAQDCSIKLCENCIRMFDSMTDKQLVSLLLIQNSRDVEIRLLSTKEQLILANNTDPKLAYNLMR